MKDYGERLAEALQARGKDRVDLARALDITPQAVGQVINGKSKMFDALNHLTACQFLDVDMVWLASGEGSMDGLSTMDRQIMTMLNMLTEQDKTRVAGYIDSVAEQRRKAA